MSELIEYPPALSTRNGCKVGWRTYASLEEANECSEVAKHNAKIIERLGYDFGYLTPGSIGADGEGNFIVCIP